MPLSKEKLGNLITQIDKRNKNTQLGIDCVRGISVKKVFTATKADLYGVSLNNYKLSLRKHLPMLQIHHDAEIK